MVIPTLYLRKYCRVHLLYHVKVIVHIMASILLFGKNCHIICLLGCPEILCWSVLKLYILCQCLVFAFSFPRLVIPTRSICHEKERFSQIQEIILIFEKIIFEYLNEDEHLDNHPNKAPAYL